MPLPTLRLPMASTSSLEFLGLTLSGDWMGAFDPGSFLAFGSAGGAAGCCGAGVLMFGCAEGSWVDCVELCEPDWLPDWPEPDWPELSWDWAMAIPEANSTAKA